MGCILEGIDSQAIDRILLAVKESGQLTQDFVNASRWDGFPAGFASDAESGAFLISVPTFIRDESGNRPYCFYFEGKPYGFTLLGFMGWDAQLAGELRPDETSFDEFHAALREAFAVHKECVGIRDGQLVALGEAVVPHFEG